MSSLKPDSDQRLSVLLDQTFGAPRLPSDQRERHLAEIGRVARKRKRGRHRAGLAEALAMAAIALVALTSIVVWQFVLTKDDSTGATTGSLYALRGLTIVEIDPESGEIRREIDRVRGAANCTFLIASSDGELLAAGDFVGIEDQVGISVYSTADGQLQQEIPVPDLLQPLGRCRSVAFSADGRKIFAYQYEAPPGGTGDDARYWLGTYDLDARVWLPEIEIPGCNSGVMQAVEIDRLFILCGAIYAIDPTTGELLRNFGWDIDGAAFLVRDGTLYEAAVTQTVLVQDLDAASDARQFLRGAPLDITERVVSGLPLGLDSSGRYLFVPVQLIGSEYAPGSEITVIDLERNQAARVITPRRRIHDIAYAADGWTAFIATSDELGAWDGLTRTDLGSGVEHELLSGQIGNLVYIPGD